MTIKHPFQLLATDEKYLYVAVKQTLQIFDLSTKCLVKSWTDELDSNYILQKQQQQKIEQLKSKNDGGEPPKKIPKVPKPGPTAPKINNFIRNLLVDDEYVIITTDTDKACAIFKKDTIEVIKFVKRVELPKRPCSIVVDHEKENVLVGDKFGDVYKISLELQQQQQQREAAEASKPDQEQQQSQHQATATAAPLTPILGHVSMLTTVNNFMKDSQEYIITTDRDEHIKISNYPTAYIIETFLFEHLNFISSTLVTSDLKLLTGGGDDFICLWDLNTFTLLEKIMLSDYIQQQPEEQGEGEGEEGGYCVSKITSFDKWYVIVLEKSQDILLIDKTDVKKFEKLSLNSNIVDLCCSKNGDELYVSLQDPSSLAIVTVTKGNNLEIEYDTKIMDNSTVQVESEAEFIPLFNTSNLRKYSEKYS